MLTMTIAFPAVCCTMEVDKNFLPLLICICLDDTFNRSDYYGFATSGKDGQL